MSSVTRIAASPQAMKRGFVRKLPALLVVAALLPALAACSASPREEYPSGDASSVVTASGDFGTQPVVDMPTPVIAHETQVSVLIEGDGEVLRNGQPVLVEATILNGGTGEVLQQSGYAGERSGVLLTVGSNALPPVTEALEGVTVGSRIVVVGTAADTHDGQAVPDSGVAADDSFVYVVDVLDAFLPKADGATRAGENGDPTVVLAPNGRPGITIPKGDAPEDLVTSVLKQGDGEVVKDGDYAVLHYTGVTWADNKVFDSSWDRDQASVMQLTAGSVVDGFHQGLVGQKVGSQVLLVIPPSLGYGDQASDTIPAGSTLVFVVDILGLAG